MKSMTLVLKHLSSDIDMLKEVKDKEVKAISIVIQIWLLKYICIKNGPLTWCISSTIANTCWARSFPASSKSQRQRGSLKNI